MTVQLTGAGEWTSRSVALDSDVVASLETLPTDVTVSHRPAIELVTTHIDTSDLRLADQGVVLVHQAARFDDGPGEWCLRRTGDPRRIEVTRTVGSWAGEVAEIPPAARKALMGLYPYGLPLIFYL